MLRFIDSCGDTYTAAQADRKWDTVTSAVVNSGGGRRGTNALQVSNTASYKKVFDSQQTWIVGMSIKTGTSFPALWNPIIFYDGTNLQTFIQVDTSGHIQLRTNVVVATSVSSLALNAYQNVQIKIKFDGSAGTYEVRVDDAVFLSGTAADTITTANPSANGVEFSGPSGGGTWLIDDIYICDGTGTSNNDFLGDVRVDAVLPTADGANTGLTPLTGIDHFAMVDETTADDDTSYVESKTVNNKDTYAFADITHNPLNIFGVQVCMTARKDDAGGRSICSVTRSGAVDTDGTAQALSTSYSTYTQIEETDPNTATAWTKTNLNAAEFGMKVQA